MNVVEGVGSLEALMSRVMHDCGGECVEAQEVSNFTTGVLKNKGSIK